MQKVLSVMIIVGILLVSAFGFLMQGYTPSSDVVPVKNDPSATPSETTTPSPTRQPNNPISDVVESVGGGKGNQQQPPSFDARNFFEKTSVMTAAAWHEVGVTAWKFYTPGKGVDSTTGLPAGSIGWNYITDWDLGVYVQAVMDAQRLNLVTSDGDWGSSMRLEKVVAFLENRELNSTTKAPYWFYSSNGTGSTSKAGFDIADTGALFVALNNLKSFNSSLASRIDDFVYNNVHGVSNRTDYASIVPSLRSQALISVDIYHYFVVAGFESFFPVLRGSSEEVLDNILSAPTVTYGNVTVHQGKISCEPLLYGLFYLPPNPKLTTILNEVYAAHVARYQITGQYVGFSEGTDRHGTFVYEWVVLPNGDMWKITTLGSDTYVDMVPIIYTQVAVSFLAIYNSAYAHNTCVFLEKAMFAPDDGYYVGAEYNVDPTRDIFVRSVSGNTNALILAAANYGSS